MAHPVAAGYTPDDLDWLRDELGVAHLELDPWGSVIVTPATEEHERAIAVLTAQLLRQMDVREGAVRVNGFAWKVPGGSGYVNVPDVAVLRPDFLPPPLVVIEVGSPSTRSVDRGRKLEDYRLGGAERYLLVDPPSMSPGGEAAFELHDFVAATVTRAAGRIEFAAGRQVVRLDLTAL